MALPLPLTQIVGGIVYMTILMPNPKKRKFLAHLETKKIPPIWRDLLARSYYTSNYFFVESTLTAEVSTLVESILAAEESILTAVESAFTSVEAPPHAANAAIAKIANTFFI